MVHITEMRVPLPITVEEFKRAQRYSNWKTNEQNTAEGQGGQLLSTAPYVNEVWGEGIFTHSLYRLGDRLPDWVTRLVPPSALVIDEKTWMAFPYIRSVLIVPFFHKLKIEMLTMHENDDGSTENIHGLSMAELAIRKVDTIDIAFDKIAKRDYQAALDPQLFKSVKTGRGPLTDGWQGIVNPMMCAYKLVRVDANYWGVQNRLEKLMLNGIRQIVLLTHRNAFCYIDDWFNLTYEEICEQELDGRRKLKAAVKQPPIINPSTGEELMLENTGQDLMMLARRGEDLMLENDDFSKAEIDESQNSDTETEYFEAQMEWTTHEEEFEKIATAESSWMLPGAPDSCAVCHAKDKSRSSPEVLCKTCNEFFCSACYLEFHITPRLKDHKLQFATELLSHETPMLDSRTSNATEISSSAEVGQKSKTRFLTQPQLAETNAQKQGLPEGYGDEQHSTQAPLTRVRSKSSHRILNSLPDYFLESSQDLPGSSARSDQSLTGVSRRRTCIRPNELSEEIVVSISMLYIRSAEVVSSSSRESATFADCFGLMDLRRTQAQEQKSGSNGGLNPYQILELRDIGPYSKLVEVKCSPTEERLGELDALYRHFRTLVERLQLVDPRDMSHEQRVAFWINIYNSLMMHAYLLRGIPWNHFRRLKIMSKSSYIVGGHLFSALAIEHSILRACSYRPSLASWLPVQKYRKHDARRAYALSHPEPLISFALCCGSKSSPVVRVYTPTNIKTELQEACRDFLTATVGLTPQSRVTIPKILQWYARDFSRDSNSLLEWITLQLPPGKRAVLLQKKSTKKSPRFLVVPYDWSFRYLYEELPEANSI